MQSRARFGSAGTLIALAACGLALASGTTLAQQGGGDDQALPEGFQVTPVLKSGKSAGGAPFSYPQTDKPEIVTATGILEPGGRTARHQHPVPVYVYVLEGTLTIEPEGGQPREYSAGQAFIEDVNHWHQAFNPGFPMWVPSMCPNATGILAETRIPLFTRRVPHDPTARSQPSA